VINFISSTLKTNSMLGDILDVCKTSLKKFQNFKISFVMRQVNNVGHLLVRASLSFGSSQVHGKILSCTDSDIINEMS